MSTSKNAGSFVEHVERLRDGERRWGRCHAIAKTSCYAVATLAAFVVSLHALVPLPIGIPQVCAILAPGLLALGGFFSRLHQWRDDTAVQLDNVLRLLTYNDGGADASQDKLLTRIDWVNIIMASAAKARPDYKQLEQLIGQKQ